MEQDHKEVKLLVGALRSDIAIELHTIPAIQIWHGRKKTDDKAEIIGITRAIPYLRMIELATKIDDPYADLWLTKINERLKLIDSLIEQETADIDKILASVPDGFKIGNVSSTAPVNVELFINISSGYKLVFLLNKLDMFVRKVQLARHVSLISGINASDRQHQVVHKLRSLIVYITKYRNLKVTRKDFAENNEKSIDAISILGPVPDEILFSDKKEIELP